MQHTEMPLNQTLNEQYTMLLHEAPVQNMHL